ncbi:MAG: nucleotide exchange factor GrpE [Erysipelotrichales bacterium]|nr:nucleotide exchange factor GrpE [Erysipelotrichales bacterium]
MKDLEEKEFNVETEPEVKEEEVPEENPEPAAEPDETETLRAEAEDWKNKYYRSIADTANLKKRLENEAMLSKKYQIQGFALNVLPALDNLERALAQETTDEALHKGVEMVRNQLVNALEAEGVKEIEAEGKPFDANFHHAIMTEEAEGKEPGTVLEVLQKGYMLKDRLLRAALVKVSE